MYSIRLDGDVRKLMKKLGKMENIDIKGANLVLAETLRTSTIERFEEERDPEGTKWEPSIRAEETGGKTLTDSSDLRRSIKSKANNSGFAIGTNKEYARTHQFGDERTIKARSSKGLNFRVNRNIIARPYIGISEDDMQEIKYTLEDLISEES